MAVNKNFVVKNGLEVNNNLLVADLDTQTVGIGTTIAPHELHVVGGIGVTNLNVTGVATIANLRVTGPSTFVGVTTFTDNNVFIDKNLFVNGINITGGSGGSIGTDLVIQRHVRAGGIVTFSDSLFVGSGLGQSTGTVGQVFQVAGVSSDAYIGGTLGIGTTNPQDLALHVVGDTRFVGVNTFQGDVVVTGNLDVTGDITYDEITGRNLNISGLATFQSLTQNRVAIVGAGDTLNDTNSLRFADNNLSQLVLGVGATVGGALTVTGAVDLNSTLDVDGLTELDDVNVSAAMTVTGAVDFNSTLDVDGLTELDDVNVSAAMTVTGAVDLNSTLDVDGLTELDDVNVGAALTVTGAVDFNSTLDVDGLTELDDVNVSAAMTVAGATDLNGALDVSGETNFSSGVGIADSIFHIGDDNTQIRFPAADTVTVETNGSEALRVVSSGNVGIGSEIPGGKLDVEGNVRIYDPSSTASRTLRITNSSQSLFLGVEGTAGGQNIVGAGAGDGTLSVNGDFALSTNNGASPQVFVTAGGDVGIGTITPTGSHAVTASNEAVLAVGIVTAREYYGDGSNLSGLPQSGIGIRSDGTAVGFGVTFLDFIGSGVGTATVDTASGIATVNISGGGGSITINNNADNRIITGSGTADTLNGEANLTFDGSQFAVVSGGATVGGALTVAGATDLNGALDVSGETNFSSGVGIADSIFHIGDDNTQIRFPANDTVTIDTGGTERVRITSTGALAIEGASNYGTSGQVLTSNGNDAPTWQDGGGISETDTTVSTINPTGVGSFATANFRSASVIAQINQLNTDYQVGRYLMIHDGTTVTVVEESAVSTGSTMLGSFTGVIDGSNVELRVTLASAGVSTITTKIDTVTV